MFSKSSETILKKSATRGFFFLAQFKYVPGLALALICFACLNEWQFLKRFPRFNSARYSDFSLPHTSLRRSFSHFHARVSFRKHDKVFAVKIDGPRSVVYALVSS